MGRNGILLGFRPMGGQPKGPAGKIPGWPLPERIQGVTFGEGQGARTALRGRKPNAQGAAFLVQVREVGVRERFGSFAGGALGAEAASD